MCENKRKAVSKFIFYKYTVMILSVIYVCVRSVCAFVHMYMIVRARARVFVCVRAFVYMYMIVCVCVYVPVYLSFCVFTTGAVNVCSRLQREVCMHSAKSH